MQSLSICRGSPGDNFSQYDLLANLQLGLLQYFHILSLTAWVKNHKHRRCHVCIIYVLACSCTAQDNRWPCERKFCVIWFCRTGVAWCLDCWVESFQKCHTVMALWQWHNLYFTHQEAFVCSAWLVPLAQCHCENTKLKLDTGQNAKLKSFLSALRVEFEGQNHASLNFV